MRTSRRNWRTGASTLFGAAVLGLAVVAYADPPGRAPADHGGASDRPDHPDRPDRPDHPDHPEHPDHADAGVRGGEQETPEQRTSRIAARHALERKIWDAVHKDGKAATEQERELVRAQWRRHARLWKIRDLAEAAKDTAATQECDRLLARSDEWLVTKLQELNTKAPAGGAK